MISLKAKASRTGLLTGIASCAMAAVPLQAQEAPAADSGSDEIETIIVTAQRREQSLNSVPIAVTALGGEVLSDRLIRTTSDIQLSLPNVTFSKDNFSSSNFTIRGIGQSVVATSADQGTGIHYNDMPLTYPRLFEAEFFDLERVEVLRGPQGTLYGRNATGGVMNIITAKPGFTLGASGSLEYDNYDGTRVEGMVNLPLLEGLAVRFAGLHIKRDGYTRNLFDGSDIDGRDQYALRGSLRYQPDDELTIDLTGYYYREKSSRARSQKQLCDRDPTGVLGCLPGRLGYQPVNANATVSSIAASREFFALVDPALATFGLTSIAEQDFLANALVPRDLRTVAIDFNPLYRAEEFVGTANVERNLGSLNASFVGGYMHSKSTSRADYDLAVASPIAASPTGSAGLGTFLNAPLTAAGAGALTRDGELCASQIEATITGYIGNNLQSCSPRTINYDESATDNRQWAGEFKIASEFDGQLNFLAGINYLHFTSETRYAVASSTGFDYPSAIIGAAQGFATTGNPGQGIASPIFVSDSTYRLEALGVFGEGYWQISDTLRFTGGLRFTRDDKRVDDFDPLPGLALGPVPLGTADLTARFSPRTTSVAFERLTGRLVLDWTPMVRFTDDTLIYASYSRGYKGGGVNVTASGLAATTASPTFAPESVDAFEIGTKNSLAGGRINLALTGFYYDYRGYQITRIVNRTAITDNTDARIYGFEAELEARPVRQVRLNASASYLDTKVRDLRLINPRDPAGGRDDALLVKDLLTGGNCVVRSNIAGASATQVLAATGTALQGAAATPGLPPTSVTQLAQAGAIATGTAAGAVPVPGLGSPGAFGICSALSAIGATAESLTGAAPFSILDGLAVDVSGNALPNAPRWRFAVGAEFEQQIGDVFALTARIDYSYTGSAFGRVFADGADRIASYDIVNAQVTFGRVDQRWRFRGFAQNLFNKSAVTGQFLLDPTSGLATNVFLLEPRRYGVSAIFAF